MPTGFALLESNSALRRHWLRRVAAMLIDMAIIFVPIRIALIFASFFDPNILAGISAGVVWFIYSGILEGYYGMTVGKRLLHLKVVSIDRKRTMKQGFVRNIPKLFWYIYLPLDALVGLAQEGDPRKRFSDTVSNTSVIAYEPEMAKIKRRSKTSKSMGSVASKKGE